MNETPTPLSDVGVVVIGRNEGDRLRACLDAVAGKAAALVYVDSGSTDGSVALAASRGALIVELDTRQPFTAARARNEGFSRLIAQHPEVAFVQFVDGDCQLIDPWLNVARDALANDEKLAAVCGRRRERFPERSIYNRLIDLEWNTPIGLARAVGGDAMFRVVALQQACGFNASIMAGEEPELCLRLRHNAWTLRRLDQEMTLHDAALLRWGQWWRRQVRSGFGALDVSRRFEVGGERLFIKPTRSAQLWAAGIPVLSIAAGIITAQMADWRYGLAAAVAVLMIYPLQALRIARGALRKGETLRIALAYGCLTLLSKFAFLAGQIRYFLDALAGKRGRLIEYKQLEPRIAEAQP